MDGLRPVLSLQSPESLCKLRFESVAPQRQTALTHPPGLCHYFFFYSLIFLLRLINIP